MFSPISSYETNSKTLIDAGIIQFAIDKMFTTNIHNESMYAKEDLTAILHNILQSGANPESIQVNKHGHTMASEYFICNIIDMIKYSMPYELNMNLIKVLAYLEGLVGTLVRFTSTLYASDILLMARQQNLTSILTELVQRNGGSDEVQRLAALGLEKLSAESINLTIKHQEMTEQRKGKRFILNCFSTKKNEGGYARVKLQVCPIHKGECSSSNTFCLLEAKAIQGLVSCLESENDGVVESALAAISTLLDERVDLERSVRELSEVDALKKVVGVLRDHQEGSIWEKTLWVIERFLVGGGEQSLDDVSRERILPKALVSAFHHDDGRTRTVADRIMRKLNQMQTSYKH